MYSSNLYANSSIEQSIRANLLIETRRAFWSLRSARCLTETDHRQVHRWPHISASPWGYNPNQTHLGRNASISRSVCNGSFVCLFVQPNRLHILNEQFCVLVTRELPTCAHEHRRRYRCILPTRPAWSGAPSSVQRPSTRITRQTCVECRPSAQYGMSSPSRVG